MEFTESQQRKLDERMKILEDNLINYNNAADNYEESMKYHLEFEHLNTCGCTKNENENTLDFDCGCSLTISIGLKEDVAYWRRICEGDCQQYNLQYWRYTGIINRILLKLGPL